MSEIPEDVMEAARKQCDLCGITTYSDMRIHAEHVAAFAILAERKRCAGVADKYAKDDMLHGEARLTAAYIRREIGAGQ